MTYALNQWEALCRYTEDGRLTIDNNVSERRLRDQAIGRKNSYDPVSRPSAYRDRLVCRGSSLNSRLWEERAAEAACIDGRSNSYSGIGHPMMVSVERAASLWLLWSEHRILDE